MAESRMAWHRFDTIFRLEARALVEQLPRHLGISLPPIVEQLATDLPTVDVHIEYLDALFRLADGSLLHIEFQTTQRRRDLERFLRYAVEIVLRHRPTRLHTVVIYGYGITSAPDRLDYGSLSYTVQNVFLGNLDGDAVLARLRQRLQQGDTLTEDDRLDLVFLGLMHHTRPLAEVFDEAVDVLRQLPEPVQRQTFAGMLGMGYRALTEQTLDSLVEKLMSTPTGLRLLEQLLERVEVAEQREQQAQAALAAQQAALAAQQAAQLAAQQAAQLAAQQEQRNAVERILAQRFGAVPVATQGRIAGTTDRDTLGSLFDLALTAGSLDEFERGLPHE